MAYVKVKCDKCGVGFKQNSKDRHKRTCHICHNKYMEAQLYCHERFCDLCDDVYMGSGVLCEECMTYTHILDNISIKN